MAVATRVVATSDRSLLFVRGNESSGSLVPRQAGAVLGFAFHFEVSPVWAWSALYDFPGSAPGFL